MKICLVSEHFFPEIGGTTTYVFELARSLYEFGHEVHLVTYRPGKVIDNSCTDEINTHYVKALDPIKKERFFGVIAFPTMLRVCLQYKVDVIHVCYGHFAIIAASLISKLLGIPIVFTVHNVPPSESSYNLFKEMRFLHTLLQKSYYFLNKLFAVLTLNLPYKMSISVSHITALKMIRLGVPESKIRIVPNGVNPRKFKKTKHTNFLRRLHIPPNSFIILNVAGIVEHKGQDILLKAAIEVTKSFPESFFVFVGPIRSTRYFDFLSCLIRKHNLGRNVLILCRVSKEDLLKIYSAASVYVQPSFEEGFGITVIEAMACGLPVIGTRTGAIPELLTTDIDQRVGILIEPGNVDQLVESLNKLIINTKLTRTMGRNARFVARSRYNWTKVAEKTLNVYMEVKGKNSSFVETNEQLFVRSRSDSKQALNRCIALVNNQPKACT